MESLSTVLDFTFKSDLGHKGTTLTVEEKLSRFWIFARFQDVQVQVRIPDYQRLRPDGGPAVAGLHPVARSRSRRSWQHLEQAGDHLIKLFWSKFPTCVFREKVITQILNAH